VSKKFFTLVQTIQKKHPLLSQENIARTLLITKGIHYKNQHSFPDHFSHYELLFTAKKISPLSVLTLLNQQSPFQLLDTGNSNEHVLLYDGEFLEIIQDYEQRLFDFKNHQDPFYFYVEEINGDLVLKLNPVQLCDFFQSTKGEMPCAFCFRNDMVQRFRNISAEELVKTILKEEKKRDNCEMLKSIDELSIITGSYKDNEEYISEICLLVESLKKYIRPDLRVVIGSHEGTSKSTFQKFKEAGVTTFAFPIEMIDDSVRKIRMKNRKGLVPMDVLRKDIESAHALFGDSGVIIRLIAGMGDKLDATFENHVAEVASLGTAGPLWNINIYMPFTHYHWNVFQKKQPYTLEYLFTYMEIINKYVPQDRQMRFKISP